MPHWFNRELRLDEHTKALPDYADYFAATVAPHVTNAEKIAYSEYADEFPFTQDIEHLRGLGNVDVTNPASYEEYIEHFKTFCSTYGIPNAVLFWRSEGNEDVTNAVRRLKNEWRKCLDIEIQKWEVNFLNELRARYVAQLAELLKNLQALAQFSNSLGMDLGRFLDWSQGMLTPQNIKQFRRWVSYLGSSDDLQKIIAVLGKVQQDNHIVRQEIESYTTIYKQIIETPHAVEETTGLTVGADLERVVPMEFAQMTDPILAALFDARFVEKRLLQFEYRGSEQLDAVDEVACAKSLVEKGPIILCIDTSGSMHGTPENIAKAITLHTVLEAQKEERPCYLISFSTEIDILDFSDANLGELIDFLGRSFHGGTDVTKALEHALEIMKTNKYEHADLVVLSDFVMGELSTSLRDLVSEQQAQGNHFYGICIGAAEVVNSSQTIFDKEWMYMPSHQGALFRQL